MNRNRLIALIGLIGALIIVVIIASSSFMRGGSAFSPTPTMMSAESTDDDGDGIPNDVDQCPFQYAPGEGCPATAAPLLPPVDSTTLPINLASDTPAPTEALSATSMTSPQLTSTADVVAIAPTSDDTGDTPESPEPTQTRVVNLPVGDQDELGSGVERAYAPFTLDQGEIGVVRLEIELYPVNLTPTFKPPLNPTETLSPNVTRPPTSTPLPLVASSELQIRTVMQARLAGVDAKKFDIVDLEPVNGIRAPEQGSVSWWEWHIRPNEAAKVGGNYSLEIIVFFQTKTANGDVIETTRGTRLTFNIQVPAASINSPKQPPASSSTVPWVPIISVVGILALIVGVVIWRQRSQSVGSVSSFLPRLLAAQPTIPFSQAVCFVSYSRRDEEFVLKFTQRLRTEGVNIWRDRDDIPAGASWDDEIDAALQRCTHVLFVASTSSVKSDNVGDELGAALSYHKLVVPILLEDCQLPFRIRRNQWVDFRGDFEAAIAKLLKDLGKSAK